MDIMMLMKYLFVILIERSDFALFLDFDCDGLVLLVCDEVEVEAEHRESDDEELIGEL